MLSHLFSSLQLHAIDFCEDFFNYNVNKKVLLRERKRHTARCVANTPYVVLTGYPPGGVPGQVPPPRGGSGYPPGGYPVRYPPGGWGGRYPVRYPPGGLGTPPGGPGTPPGGSGYPLGGVPSQVPPLGVRVPPRGGLGTPPGVPSQVPPRGEGGYPDPPSPPWTDKHL